MQFWQSLANLWHVVPVTWRRWFRKPPPPVPPPPIIEVRQPEPLPEPLPIAPAIEPPAADTYEEKYNRAQRRAMERARRRHDKFIKPKGKLPPRPPRAPRPPKEPAEPEVLSEPVTGFTHDDDSFVWNHEISGEQVLYHNSEQYGQFSFRDTILDQMERYFMYLRRMQKHDPDSYSLYRQIGAYIVPYMTSHVGRWDDEKKDQRMTDREIEVMRAQCVLPSSFLKNRPGFGCFAYGTDFLTEKRENMKSPDPDRPHIWIPKFMYFTKYERPSPVIQPVHGGDTYKMTIWWDHIDDKKDKKDKKRGGVPTDYAVFISRDGTDIRILRILETQTAWAEPKRRRNGHKEHTKTPIRVRSWHYPEFYKDWASQYGVTAQLHLKWLFCNSIEIMESAWAGSMIRVGVSKDDMAGCFGVDVRRMSYFFKDRDITLTENGARRRVFHVVRAHMREDGSVVKMHFRGEKEFTWAGYDVRITLPGKDHHLLSEFKGGLTAEERALPNVEYDDMNTLGKLMANDIAGRPLKEGLEELRRKHDARPFGKRRPSSSQGARH
jgi:hypothetical protein